MGVPLSHVWQEQRGFRAGEIRNRAIRVSRGDYCVFLDGDCLARPDFVAAHRRLAERGWFVTGNRALLTRSLTDAVLRGRARSRAMGNGGLDRAAVQGRIQPPGAGAAPAARAVAQDAAADLGGRALVQSRGLAFRSRQRRWLRRELQRAGARRIPICWCGCCTRACAARTASFATGVLHLWHPDADRSRLTDNEQRLAHVIESRRVRAERGISSLDRDAALPVAGQRMAAREPAMATTPGHGG